MTTGTNRLAAVFSTAILSATCAAAAGAGEAALPLYPQPRSVTRAVGAFDAAGREIVIPADAGEKSQAVAEALAKQLARHLKLPAAPAVKREGAGLKGRFVLALGRGPAAWAAAEKDCSFDKAHETLRDQAYYLDISPDGAVLVAPGSWGLAYGAVTLMQLARCASDGTKLPCARILDWPDLELRAVLSSAAGTPPDHRRAAAALCLDGKLNMLSQNFPLSSETHPELSLKVKSDAATQAELRKIVRDIRGAGVELPAGASMDRGHFWEHKSNPYVFMRDGAICTWAMQDVIDERLEVFRSRHFSLGMDEEEYSMSHGEYPNRTLEQHRDVVAGWMKYLRRKGVMGMIWTDVLAQAAQKSQYFPWTYKEKLPEGFNGFVDTFPSDLILKPWFYWVKSTDDVFDGRGDMRRQAKTGHPVIFAADGGNIDYHIAAARMIKKDQPNVLGVMSCAWGPSPFIKDTQDPRHPRYVVWAVGRSWNLDAGKEPPKGFTEERTLDVSNWECLLDADPPASVDEALERLKAPAWRTWLAAREELVAAGLPAAPALLAAMSRADEGNRERIEGCLSRNARDARNGRVRGKLDLSGVLPYLNDGNEAVRDMAAEMAVSCSDVGAAGLRKRLRDQAAGASCIRALGIARDKDCAGELAGIVADKAAPVRARSEAARVLGLLRHKDAGAALQRVLKEAGEKELRLAALWALVLMQHGEAENECAALLGSEDLDFRYRAAMGLLALKSPRLELLVPWLSKDRDSMEIAGLSLYLGWDRRKMAAALEEARKTQKDEVIRRRLDAWAEHLKGK